MAKNTKFTFEVTVIDDEDSCEDIKAVIQKALDAAYPQGEAEVNDNDAEEWTKEPEGDGNED